LITRCGLPFPLPELALLEECEKLEELEELAELGLGLLLR
jgi:hypothetical protein